MKKFLICLISVFILFGTVCVSAAKSTDVIQTSTEYIPKRVLTADGSLWLDKKAVENTKPGSDVCETFPWLRRFDGLDNIVSFSGDAAIDKDGNVWLVTVGNTVKVEKTEITNAKKVLYFSTEYSVILKKDGTVCTYRFKTNSEFFPYTEYTYDQRGYDIKIDNVVDIVTYYHGTLALKKDGTVWGIEAGGLRPYALPGTITQHGTDEYPLTDIVSIFANGQYAVACGADGSVYSLYGSKLHFGDQHTGKRIEKLPIRNVKNAYLHLHFSIFVKKDGTAWFAGYPKVEDFTLYYDSITTGNPTHNDNFISEITQVDIKNVKLAWENGFVKSNNTFWVLGRRGPFYDALGNDVGSVTPKNIDVACLTEEPVGDEEATIPEEIIPDENETPGESTSGDNEYGNILDQFIEQGKGKYPWENNVVAVPITGDGNKTEVPKKKTPQEMTDEELEEIIKERAYSYIPDFKNYGTRNTSKGSKFYFEFTNDYDFELSGICYFPIFDEEIICREFLIIRYTIPPKTTIDYTVESEIKWANLDWDGFYMFYSENSEEHLKELKKRLMGEYCIGLYRKEKALSHECSSFVLNNEYLSDEELAEVRDIFRRNRDIVYSR